MDKVEFKTYIVKKKISLFGLFCSIMALVSISGFILKSVMQTESSHWFLSINFGLMFFVFFFLLILTPKLKGAENYKILEELVINDEYIKVGDSQFKLNEIENLRIDYDGVFGEAKGNRHIPDGVGNMIHFKWNGNLISYYFRIANFKEKAIFLDMLASLYRKNYQFIENHQYYGRTYLLKKLSYQEIQEFKLDKRSNMKSDSLLNHKE